MKNRSLFLFFCISFMCLIPQLGQPSTTFCLNNGDQPVVGKNLDFYIGDGLVIVNKRNVSKTAKLIDTEDGQPASWISKYGSVTFNYIGREFPSEGVNETGLVVQIMELPGKTEYPTPDSRPYTSPPQWIQFQLDNFSTVEEVIASDSQLRIKSRGETLVGGHFLICDSMGNCIIIEFINGKMVPYTNETMPVKVLTNGSTYTESLEFLYQHVGWGGELPIPEGDSELDRFVRAADMVRNYDPETSESAVDYSFDILTNVAKSGVFVTQWSIVYDIQNLRIYFHTLENEQTRYINLSSFNFSCKTPVKVLDINDDLSGDVSNNFIDYTYKINRDLIEKTTIIFDYTDEQIDSLASYPDSTVCTEVDCFIATAAYGSLMEPQVKILREFRDRFLLDNSVGKTFVHLYHTYSPPIADFIANHDNVRAMVRLSLLPIIGVSWLALKLGPVLTLLLSLLLLALISTSMVVVLRKRVTARTPILIALGLPLLVLAALPAFAQTVRPFNLPGVTNWEPEGTRGIRTDDPVLGNNALWRIFQPFGLFDFALDNAAAELEEVCNALDRTNE